MACEQERRLIDLANRLVDHYQEKLDEADKQLQDLLEAIPNACEHVGIPKLNHLFPSQEVVSHLFREPDREGSTRELDEECYEAIQEYYKFRRFGSYRRTSLWLKASNMLQRFKEKLSECEHGSKHE